METSSEIVNILLYVGSAIVTAMAAAIVVLWRAKESRDRYIREQDKANMVLMTDISNTFKNLGVNVSKIEDALSDRVTPKIAEIRRLLHELLKSQ